MKKTSKPLKVSSRISKEEQGVTLLAAILQTLHHKDQLHSYMGIYLPSCVEGPLMDEGTASGLPWLHVGDMEGEGWTPELVLDLYSRLDAKNLDDLLALDLWLLAISGQPSSYWGLQEHCISRPTMASLLERGADPLRALKRWRH